MKKEQRKEKTRAKHFQYDQHICSIIRTVNQLNHANTEQSSPRGCKTFFMLNSAMEEILNADKYKNIKKFSFIRLRYAQIAFYLHINVKMPTIVGILTFMRR